MDPATSLYIMSRVKTVYVLLPRRKHTGRTSTVRPHQTTLFWGTAAGQHHCSKNAVMLPHCFYPSGNSTVIPATELDNHSRKLHLSPRVFSAPQTQRHDMTFPPSSVPLSSHSVNILRQHSHPIIHLLAVEDKQKPRKGQNVIEREEYTAKSHSAPYSETNHYFLIY